jgi:pimeloyl-ACP methyl ester carboxylesterase
MVSGLNPRPVVRAQGSAAVSYPDTPACWRYQVAALNRRVSPDLRGFGAPTSWPNWTVRYITDLLDVFDELGVERAPRRARLGRITRPLSGR